MRGNAEIDGDIINTTRSSSTFPQTSTAEGELVNNLNDMYFQMYNNPCQQLAAAHSRRGRLYNPYQQLTAAHSRRGDS
jgi:hypothetical protein